MEVVGLENSEKFKEILHRKWNNLVDVPEIFRYKLNHKEADQKILAGKIGFFLQLNKDRTLLRRKPDSIKSVTPQFDHDKFNFNKARPEERLFDVEHSDGLFSFLINNSPLTECHSLICPNVEGNRAQMLTTDSIEFAIQLLWLLDDRVYRLGFNSAGAMASVNHQHLHLIKLDVHLYVEDAKLIFLAKNLYKLDETYKIPGYCLIVTDKSEINTIVEDISTIVDHFCRKNIPHNLFFTYGSDPRNGTTGGRNVVRIYVFPRAIYYETKEVFSFNMAFCELAGFIPVGSDEIFQRLTEEIILESFREYLGDVKPLECDIVKLFVDK